MTTGSRVGFLWMDTSATQEYLRNALHRALSVLCLVLEVAAHQRLSEALTNIQSLVRALSGTPISLDEFAAFVRHFSDLQANQTDVFAEVAVINVRFQPSSA
jgi:hypothetical protein